MGLCALHLYPFDAHLAQFCKYAELSHLDKTCPKRSLRIVGTVPKCFQSNYYAQNILIIGDSYNSQGARS